MYVITMQFIQTFNLIEDMERSDHTRKNKNMPLLLSGKIAFKFIHMMYMRAIACEVDLLAPLVNRTTESHTIEE